MHFRVVGVAIAVLSAAPVPLAAQTLCGPDPPGSAPRPLWTELAPPGGSGYPDYQSPTSNLQILASLTLLASLTTRAAERLDDLASDVEDPEASGNCVCCISTGCALPEIHPSTTRKACVASLCSALEGQDYPLWLPTDLFKDEKKAARFALKYLGFLDDIQQTLGDVAMALNALGTGIENQQQLLAMYLAYVDTFAEGFHLGGYSTERPNLHLCVGYGGHGAFAEMLNLFGEVSIGSRYTSHNLSREHRAQFRAGGFGVTAFGRAISLLPGIEANLQIDGFKLWDAARPFGIDFGIAGDPTCADGPGMKLADVGAYDVFHLLDPSTDLMPFDTSGDGCLQPGEFLIRDYYPADYVSAADGQPHVWPRPAFSDDWEKQNTAVVSAGLNLPIRLAPIEKLLPPSGIVLFPGATLFPKLTLTAGATWTHEVNALRARLQQAVNAHLPAAAQLGAGAFERPMHALQAPDVSEDDGSAASVQPRVAADLVLGLALSKFLTLGVTASIGTSVRVEPAAHGGVHDLNVALGSALLHSNPAPDLPCEPIIAATSTTICSNGLYQSHDPEADPPLVPLSSGTYTCDTTQVVWQHCAAPETARECTPETAADDCPETKSCEVEYGCAGHGVCTRTVDTVHGPLEMVEHDTTYQACIGEPVCDDAAVNAGAACDEDRDCFGPLQCVGGPRAGMACTSAGECREGACTAPTAPCVQVSPAGYFTPYQCLVRQEPAITGWQGSGCHPLTVGFPSACGCADDGDCVAGQETCVDGRCEAGDPQACGCDPGLPQPCGPGRVCAQGACVLDCSAGGDADCAAHQTCSGGACANTSGVPFAEQIVWQLTHTPAPQHAVASYALSDILASAILDAGLRVGLDLKIFKKLVHYDLLDLRDWWTLLAINKSWYQAGLDAQYQHECAPVAAATVSNWQPGPTRVTRYNPLGAAAPAYGNAGTLADLQDWCENILPADVQNPGAPGAGDLSGALQDLLDWGEQIGGDVWALGGLCVTHSAGGTMTSMPFTDWLQALQANPGALGCTYQFNNQIYTFPCSALANQLLLVWGCLDTTANPFAPLLAGLPGVTTVFDGRPVFDLPAMLIDPTTELTLDNLQPAIRHHGLDAGAFWYAAVAQCFEQHQAAVQLGDVQIGAVQLGPCCGNGVLDQSGCAQGPGVPPCEQCDDGNHVAGDGCTPLCRNEGRMAPLGRCGNGLVEHQDFEECDDGNQNPGDGCEPDCRLTSGTPPPNATATGTAPATPTQTPRITPTAPATATATSRGTTPTATRTHRPRCVADCDASATVTIEELITAVSIALERSPLATCPAADANGDERVTIDELVRAVRAALSGCETVSGAAGAQSAVSTGMSALGVGDSLLRGSRSRAHGALRQRCFGPRSARPDHAGGLHCMVRRSVPLPGMRMVFNASSK